MRRVLLNLLVLVIPFAALAQNTPPEVDVALADLSEQLGIPLTLDMVDNWTWDEEDFGDTSLGCPQPEQMYAQVLTRGYIITFTLDGTTYDYRAPANSGQAFLCSIVEGTPAAGTPEATLPVEVVPGGVVITAENAEQLAQVDMVEGNFTYYMDYSPTGQTIAVAGLTVPDPASNDTPAILIYAANDLSAAPEELLPGGEPVVSLTYFPTDVGASLVTGGMQGTIASFPVEPPGFDILIVPPVIINQTLGAVATNPDGTLIAAAVHSLLSAVAEAEQGVYLWNANTGEQVALIAENTSATSVAFSPNGTMLATGDITGTIQVWDVSNPTVAFQIATLEGHSDLLRDLEFSPDGTVLASASMDTTVRLWNVDGEAEEFGEIAVLDSGNDEPALTLDFSPDGMLLAVGGGDSEDEDAESAISIWDMSAVSGVNQVDVPDAELVGLVATVTGHEGAVGSVAFSPDGTRIASASGDQTLRLWTVGDVAVG